MPKSEFGKFLQSSCLINLEAKFSYGSNHSKELTKMVSDYPHRKNMIKAGFASRSPGLLFAGWIIWKIGSVLNNRPQVTGLSILETDCL